MTRSPSNPRYPNTSHSDTVTMLDSDVSISPTVIGPFFTVDDTILARVPLLNVRNSAAENKNVTIVCIFIENSIDLKCRNDVCTMSWTYFVIYTDNDRKRNFINAGLINIFTGQVFSTILFSWQS